MDTRKVLIVAALAAGAWWLYQRQARAAATPQRVPSAGRTSTGLAYATPTAVAELLAAGVNLLTRGIRSSPPVGVTPSTAQAEFRRAEQQADPSYYGWSRPTYSIVDTGDPYNPLIVDASVTAPVYDPSLDLIANPYSLQTP